MATAKSKRRSSLFPRQSDSLNETPLIEEPLVDEESERKNRMKLQKRQSFGPGATPVAADTNQGSISGYSAGQLAELYSTCMKLSAENRINMKKCPELLTQAGEERGG